MLSKLFLVSLASLTQVAEEVPPAWQQYQANISKINSLVISYHRTSNQPNAGSVSFREGESIEDNRMYYHIIMEQGMEQSFDGKNTLLNWHSSDDWRNSFELAPGMTQRLLDRRRASLIGNIMRPFNDRSLSDVEKTFAFVLPPAVAKHPSHQQPRIQILKSTDEEVTFRLLVYIQGVTEMQKSIRVNAFECTLSNRYGGMPLEISRFTEDQPSDFFHTLDLTTKYLDYEQLEGVWLPHQTQYIKRGRVANSIDQIDKIEINGNIPTVKIISGMRVHDLVSGKHYTAEDSTGTTKTSVIEHVEDSHSSLVAPIPVASSWRSWLAWGTLCLGVLLFARLWKRH